MKLLNLLSELAASDYGAITIVALIGFILIGIGMLLQAKGK